MKINRREFTQVNKFLILGGTKVYICMSTWIVARNFNKQSYHQRIHCVATLTCKVLVIKTMNMHTKFKIK